MNLIWKYSFMLMLVWYANHVSAQTALELQTAQLFNTPITWIKQFQGKINGIHQATLSLGFDGVNCKGYMTYTSSGDKYLLEGTIQDKHLVLLEKYKNEPSGYIDGQIDVDQINLNWKSIDESITYSGEFARNNKELINRDKQLIIYAGFLDEQSVKMTLQKTGSRGSGNLIYTGQRIEKLYANYVASGNIKVENLGCGYSFELVNTKENQFEASFILPGSSVASHLTLRSITNLDIDTEEYLSHDVNYEISIPSVDAAFDEAIQNLIAEWEADMAKQKNKTAGYRFGNKAKIWLEIESFTDEYLSGVVFYNSSWNKEVASETFTYVRKESEMLSLAPFLKGSTKWEQSIKERMIAAKELNNTTEKDQYKKWIERVDLMDPILCEGGIQFFTPSNSVFGQANTFLPWESISPLVMSPGKLSKLRKSK